MTVEGIVTTRRGLLDSSGERVTIQDATAAVLLRLPADTTVEVGQRVRVLGAMATYYGAPQLSATSLTPNGQGNVSSTTVNSAPLGASLEWRLVTVSGTVDSVQKDGDAWRAELKLASGSVPISGIDRSGIPATALAAGRSATVTGIVKRAYPTATDQRLAIVPRSNADIKLGDVKPSTGPSPSSSAGATVGPGVTLKPGATLRPGTTLKPGATLKAGMSAGPAAPGGGGPIGSDAATGTTGSNAPGAMYATISSLAEHVGEVVRIGGRVVSMTDGVVAVDDGTAQVGVRLTGSATALTERLAISALINVTGSVGRTATGELEIVVDDPHNLAVIPTPASLAAATAATAMAAGTTREPGFDAASAPAETATAGHGFPVPLLVLSAILFAIAAGLIGLVAAGPQRRARLVAALQPVLARLRKLSLRSA